MRPSQKPNRNRGRGGRKPNGANVNRVYESNGPNALRSDLAGEVDPSSVQDDAGQALFNYASSIGGNAPDNTELLGRAFLGRAFVEEETSEALANNVRRRLAYHFLPQSFNFTFEIIQQPDRKPDDPAYSGPDLPTNTEFDNHQGVVLKWK